ncbi:MAG: LysR family transcriptional regulator [Alphaproteobacteria bacterium]|nr:LysR family transcriptional regulator [Alphaproteobacteria bacterium]
MDRLTLLRAFARVADRGSLTAAARDLKVGQSTVSKWLAALEEEAGVPLVDRTTRRLRVTEAGQTLLGHARTLVEGWDDALAEVQAQAHRVAGPLRVSLPVVFGTRHVVPHLGPFLAQHPRLDLTLRFSDRYVDLLEQEVHVALRVGVAVPSTLRARRLGGTPRRLVAAPRALKRLGAPGHPRDLAGVEALLHTGVSRAVWTLHRGEETVRVDVGGRVRADNSEALRQLAVAGQGVALLAAWLVDEDIAAGRLVPLLEDWAAPEAPIRALLPPSRHVPGRVRAFLDHLEAAWAGGLGARSGILPP